MGVIRVCFRRQEAGGRRQEEQEFSPTPTTYHLPLIRTNYYLFSQALLIA
ncbi:MAG: hypothetical protein F6J96_19185 [Symploca sp. SIO1C2]|nr:hypothetical protein [Symploca sp. SIO1C2]